VEDRPSELLLRSLPLHIVGCFVPIGVAPTEMISGKFKGEAFTLKCGNGFDELRHYIGLKEVTMVA
jgi:hypothetical protein